MCASETSMVKIHLPRAPINKLTSCAVLVSEDLETVETIPRSKPARRPNLLGTKAAAKLGRIATTTIESFILLSSAITNNETSVWLGDSYKFEHVERQRSVDHEERGSDCVPSPLARARCRAGTTDVSAWRRWFFVWTRAGRGSDLDFYLEPFRTRRWSSWIF